MRDNAMLGNQIDMICFNQECIAYQNQLFLYGSSNRYQHSVHEDQCANLHPFFFNRKYVRQVPVLLEIKAEFEEQLKMEIDETVQKVADALRSKLTQYSSEIYDRELDQFRVENCQKMLQKIKANRQASQEISFINCLFLEDIHGMKNHVVKKMKKCEEQISHSLSRLDMQLGLKFQQVIKKFDFKQQKKVMKAPQKNVKLQSQDSPIFESSRFFSEKFTEKEPNQKEDMHIEENSSEQLSQSINKINTRKQLKTNKTKPIQKAIKSIKLHCNRPKEKCEQESQESYEPTKKNQKNANKDDTYIIRKDVDWINLLKKSINCKKLVVYYPLVQEDLIKVINKTSPKEIYINYQAQLSENFIENISTHVLQHLEKFQEFWDQNQFFDQVLNNHYFPTDDFRHIDSVKKIHFTKSQLNLIPKITNIWISNANDLQQLTLSYKDQKQIESLRIESCKCCKSLSQKTVTQIFKIFKESQNIKSLILKCQVLNNQNTQLLRQLTQNNKRIQSVILQLQGKFIPQCIIECFTSLPLKQLSISKERNNNQKVVYMDITPITEIRTLRKLAMTCMFFTTQEVKKAEIESGKPFILDEQVAEKISKLTKLVFLDLFRCSPIYYDIVQLLSEKVKSQLYHLNLSHTFMESEIIKLLISLPRLKELNLDRTIVPLKELLTQIAKKPLHSVKKLSLFYYNGDELDINGNIQSNFKFSPLKTTYINKISDCFPNLQYLNIAFCSHFSNLADDKFKKLKHLCSNKKYMSPAKIEKLRHKRGIEVYLYDGNKPV